MAKLTKKQEQEKQESIATLREWLEPGDKILCVLNRVSKSGMTREINLYKCNGDGDVQWIGYHAARALGMRLGKADGIIIGGCGMDMGFALVSALAATIFRDDPRATTYEGKGQPNMSARVTDRAKDYWLTHRWL